MTGFEVALLLLLCCTAAPLLVGLWVASRLMRPEGEPSGVDPIRGARNPVAIYRIGDPLVRPHRDVLVPMPDHLTGRDEMVAWLTKDLPELMDDAFRPPR
jgi:hypothetical protein